MIGPISALSSVPASDSQGARAVGEARHDPVGHVAHEHGDGDGHASLAGRAVRGTDERIDGLVEVRVRHHDHVVLGAAESLHAFAAPGAFFVHVLCHRGGADEAHGADVRMRQDRAHERRVAVDHVEKAVRQARALEQLRHQERRGWVPLAGLQDERVAAGERDGKHPARHHAREVEGRDAGDHAERLPDRPVVEAVRHLVREVPLQHGGHAAGEFDDLDPAHHFAARIGDHLAVLLGDEGRERVPVPVQQVQEFEHHAGAPDGRRVGPRGLSFQCCIHRRIQVLPGAERHVPNAPARCRVEHRLGSRPGAADEAPADPVFEKGGRGTGCVLGRHAGEFMWLKGLGSREASLNTQRCGRGRYHRPFARP
jgi:hypothetical protein